VTSRRSRPDSAIAGGETARNNAYTFWPEPTRAVPPVQQVVWGADQIVVVEQLLEQSIINPPS
ncbi:MAG: hypothetical protein R6X32_03795, partial [Chloroflexota bacterium]